MSRTLLFGSLASIVPQGGGPFETRPAVRIAEEPAIEEVSVDAPSHRHICVARPFTGR